MRCRRCQYVLLNLAKRECPECGETFAPSDYSFVPGSVRFCCPHCDQAFYGTDGNGLPVPRAFACVSCRREVSIDEFVVRPLEGVTDEPIVRSPMPWLDRQRGWWRTFLPTIGRGMIEPKRLMEGVPPGNATGRAWGFLVLNLVLTVFGGLLLPMMVIGVLMLMTGDPSWAELLAIGLAITVGSVTGVLLLVVLWGLTAHLLLKVTGGATHPIGRTYEALCFSSAPMLLAMVPCLGPYLLWMVGAVWWVVSATIMVAAGQKVHGGRASVAVLAGPLLAVVVGIGSLVAVTIMADRASDQWLQVDNDATRTIETQLVLSALIDWTDTHDNAGPSHPLLLMADGRLSAWDFVASDTSTILEEVPLGVLTLAWFDGMDVASEDELDTKLREARAPRAGDAPARIGDFVFAYAGIDCADLTMSGSPDPDPRWVVILCGAPEAAPHEDVNTGPVVGFSDGSVETIPWSDFAARLVGENIARTNAGLPLIPDPAALEHVTDGAP